MQIDIREKRKGQIVELSKKFELLSKTLGDCRPLWDEFEKWYLDNVTKKAWASRGGVFGDKWAAYSPDYFVWRRKHGHGSKSMLVLSGKMQQAAYMGQGYYAKKEKYKMTFGIDGEDYFTYIQQGTTKMPSRPYMFENVGSKYEAPPMAYRFFIVRLKSEIEKKMNEASK
jgi:hypothetical protein